MKEKTKDIITVGGLAIAALGVYYFMTPGAEGAVGGFGGGGIPLLPGDTEGAAEEDLTTIIYNLPTPESSPFAAAPEPFVKKTAAMPTGDIATAVSELTPSTKLYGGFALPELRAAPMEFFESDIFAQQTGLMTRTRTSEVIQDMLKESKKRGYITQTITQKHHEAASKHFDPSKYRPSSKSKKEVANGGSGTSAISSPYRSAATRKMAAKFSGGQGY